MQSKSDFALQRIIELVDAVIERESIPKEGQSYADLGFVKYYAKEMMPCKDCAEEGRGVKKDSASE